MEVTTSLKAATAVAAGTAVAPEQVFETVISSEDVERGSVEFHDPVIQFALTEEGSRKLGDFTASRLGQSIAFLLDGQVIWTTTIEGEVSGGVTLSALRGSDARFLAIVLRSGPLPMPLAIVRRTALPAAVICQP